MKKVLIIAGESSGDLHSASLIKASLAKNPELAFFGIGGDKMRAAGADILIDNKALAVVGIIEVLTHFKIIKAAFRQIETILKTTPPDLLILVDYPGFNLRLAKIAKKLNIKILYFISPQLWAWKQGRIKIMRHCIDKIAVILPFEVDFYRQHGVDACYVGNPLVDEVHPSISKELAYKNFNLDPTKPIIALLPGSRQSELKFILAIILQTAQRIQESIPEVQFILPLSNHFSEAQLLPLINQYNLKITMVSNQLYNILQIATAALSVSGTVTLEIALMQVPFAILYKVNWLTGWLGRMLIKIDMAGLCNIVAGKKIAQEFIQQDAVPEKISAEMLRLLNDADYRQQQINEFAKLRDLFKQYPSENIGEVVVGMVEKN